MRRFLHYLWSEHFPIYLLIFPAGTLATELKRTTASKKYSVGGSSNIQNISPFMEEQFGVECENSDVTNPKIKIKNIAHILPSLQY